MTRPPTSCSGTSAPCTSMILPWALRYAAPEGVDHARWAAALEQAIRALFPLT